MFGLLEWAQVCIGMQGYMNESFVMIVYVMVYARRAYLY
jgi:hypothetical protein